MHSGMHHASPNTSHDLLTPVSFVTAHITCTHLFNPSEILIIFFHFQHHISMTEYKKEFPFPVMFPPEVPKNVLAEWLGSKKVPQYHCAGTLFNVEKIVHKSLAF